MAQSIARSTYGSSRLLAAALAGMVLIGAGGASAQSEDGSADEAHQRSHPIREGGHTVSPNPQSTAMSGEKVDAGNALNAVSTGENARAGDPIPGIDITANRKAGAASGGPLCDPCTFKNDPDADGDLDDDGLADPDVGDSDTARGGFKAGKALAETVKRHEQPSGATGGPGDADGDGLGDADLSSTAAARSGRNPQTGKEIK